MITPHVAAQVPPQTHSSTILVEEAYGYVQGESLKPYATLLREVYQLPDHQDQGLMMSDLITCADCDKIYNSNNDKCPHCSGKKTVTKVKIVFGILAIGLAYVVITSNGDNKAGQAKSGESQTEQPGDPAVAKLSFAECVRYYIRTGAYTGKDGGQSALSIMGECNNQVRKEFPICFQNDPKDNSADNHEQLSPGAGCRIRVVALINRTLLAEGY